jgi:hypothetical protein
MSRLLTPYNCLEFRKVDVQVLTDRQNLDGYWYQEVEINNGERWQIQYEGMEPSKKTTVNETKQWMIDNIKEHRYHAVKSNCHDAQESLQTHLNPERVPPNISGKF